MTTTAANTVPQPTNSSIWIVQRQYYYYSDEYCATASHPDGWFMTELAAKTHWLKKNMQILEEFASDYDTTAPRFRRLKDFLALPEEEQQAALMSPTFDTEALGISYDYSLDWYEVVKLDCLA